MANVFIQPGTGAAQNQRSIDYDTDQFSRVLNWIGSFAALRPSPAHPLGGASIL